MMTLYRQLALLLVVYRLGTNGKSSGSAQRSGPKSQIRKDPPRSILRRDCQTARKRRKQDLARLGQQAQQGSPDIANTARRSAPGHTALASTEAAPTSVGSTWCRRVSRPDAGLLFHGPVARGLAASLRREIREAFYSGRGRWAGSGNATGVLWAGRGGPRPTGQAGVWRNRLNGRAGPLQGSRVFATWMVTMRELPSTPARMHYREVQTSTPV